MNPGNHGQAGSTFDDDIMMPMVAVMVPAVVMPAMPPVMAMDNDGRNPDAGRTWTPFFPFGNRLRGQG